MMDDKRCTENLNNLFNIRWSLPSEEKTVANNRKVIKNKTNSPIEVNSSESLKNVNFIDKEFIAFTPESSSKNLPDKQDTSINSQDSFIFKDANGPITTESEINSISVKKHTYNLRRYDSNDIHVKEKNVDSEETQNDKNCQYLSKEFDDILSLKKSSSNHGIKKKSKKRSRKNKCTVLKKTYSEPPSYSYTLRERLDENGTGNSNMLVQNRRNYNINKLAASLPTIPESEINNITVQKYPYNLRKRESNEICIQENTLNYRGKKQNKNNRQYLSEGFLPLCADSKESDDILSPTESISDYDPDWRRKGIKKKCKKRRRKKKCLTFNKYYSEPPSYLYPLKKQSQENGAGLRLRREVTKCNSTIKNSQSHKNNTFPKVSPLKLRLNELKITNTTRVRRIIKNTTNILKVKEILLEVGSTLNEIEAVLTDWNYRSRVPTLEEATKLLKIISKVNSSLVQNYRLISSEASQVFLKEHFIDFLKKSEDLQFAIQRRIKKLNKRKCQDNIVDSVLFEFQNLSILEKKESNNKKNKFSLLLKKPNLVIDELSLSSSANNAVFNINSEDLQESTTSNTSERLDNVKTTNFMKMKSGLQENNSCVFSDSVSNNFVKENIPPPSTSNEIPMEIEEQSQDNSNKNYEATISEDIPKNNSNKSHNSKLLNEKKLVNETVTDNSNKNYEAIISENIPIINESLNYKVTNQQNVVNETLTNDFNKNSVKNLKKYKKSVCITKWVNETHTSLPKENVITESSLINQAMCNNKIPIVSDNYKIVQQAAGTISSEQILLNTNSSDTNTSDIPAHDYLSDNSKFNHISEMITPRNQPSFSQIQKESSISMMADKLQLSEDNSSIVVNKNKSINTIENKNIFCNTSNRPKHLFIGSDSISCDSTNAIDQTYCNSRAKQNETHQSRNLNGLEKDTNSDLKQNNKSAAKNISDTCKEPIKQKERIKRSYVRRPSVNKSKPSNKNNVRVNGEKKNEIVLTDMNSSTACSEITQKYTQMVSQEENIMNNTTPSSLLFVNKKKENTKNCVELFNSSSNVNDISELSFFDTEALNTNDTRGNTTLQKNNLNVCNEINKLDGKSVEPMDISVEISTEEFLQSSDLFPRTESFKKMTAGQTNVNIRSDSITNTHFINEYSRNQSLSSNSVFGTNSANNKNNTGANSDAPVISLCKNNSTYIKSRINNEDTFVNFPSRDVSFFKVPQNTLPVLNDKTGKHETNDKLKESTIALPLPIPNSTMESVNSSEKKNQESNDEVQFSVQIYNFSIKDIKYRRVKSKSEYIKVSDFSDLISPSIFRW